MWLNNKYCSGNELDFTVTMNLPSFVACLKSQFALDTAVNAHDIEMFFVDVPVLLTALKFTLKTWKQGQKHILITNIAIQWNEKSWVWKKWQKCEGDCVFLTLFLSFLEYNETHILEITPVPVHPWALGHWWGDFSKWIKMSQLLALSRGRILNGYLSLLWRSHF